MSVRECILDISRISKYRDKPMRLGNYLAAYLEKTRAPPGLDNLEPDLERWRRTLDSLHDAASVRDLRSREHFEVERKRHGAFPWAKFIQRRSVKPTWVGPDLSELEMVRNIVDGFSSMISSLHDSVRSGRGMKDVVTNEVFSDSTVAFALKVAKLLLCYSWARKRITTTLHISTSCIIYSGPSGIRRML